LWQTDGQPDRESAKFVEGPKLGGGEYTRNGEKKARPWPTAGAAENQDLKKRA